MIVLGLHLSHDASAALVVDGRIVAAASEERFRRVKLFCGFPTLAIERVLRVGGVRPEQVDRIAVATKEIFRALGWREVKKRMATEGQAGWERKKVLVDRVASYFLGRRPEVDVEEDRGREIFLDALERDHGLRRSRVGFYDHHTCHAASALYTSPFDEATVITLDGRGDGLCGTAWDGRGWELRRRTTIGDLHSLGMFYAAVTCFLGFRPNRHEGKVTGLAARGDVARLYPAFRRLFRVDPERRTVILELSSEPPARSPDELAGVLRRLPLRLKDRINLMANVDFEQVLYAVNYYSMLAHLERVAGDAPREDVAAAAQRVAEDVACELARSVLPPGIDRPLCLAGGVFANVRINQRLRELDSVSNVYVQPAMGDDGLALGAALLGSLPVLRAHGDERPCRMNDAYLGPGYDEAAIVAACRREGVAFERRPSVHADIACHIHAGKLVGRFVGRMEWGPRALGHRSILIRPVDKAINDSVNHRLHRTEFMPFAPSMLEEVAADYLVGWRPDHVAAEYMTATYEVVADRRRSIEAVVHVDGTARPQVVSADRNPDFHAILSEYRKLSGLGVAVNTSFNMHEEPIVESPSDAIRSLKRGCVDVLMLEDYEVALG